METTFGGLLLFGLLAAGANVLGGLILVKSGIHRFGERFLKYLVALGAGFMLAAIFIEILPETVSSRGSYELTAGWLSIDPAFRTHARATLSLRR
jgi:zinc transporter ZupT